MHTRSHPPISCQTEKVSEPSFQIRIWSDDHRDERDERVISLGLHIVRNLLSIRDAVAEGTVTGKKEELANLQVRSQLLFLYVVNSPPS